MNHEYTVEILYHFNCGMAEKVEIKKGYNVAA